MTDNALTTTNLSAGQMLEGLRTVQSVLAPDLTPEELRLFAMVANRSGLDPFAKQIYAVKRKGRVTFQTGIDGYRSIAARTGLYDGQDEPEYGPVHECGDNRPVGHPEYATVRVYRKGVSRAIAATAYWHEYKPEAGQSGHGDDMWTRMPRVMIAKVAEALALRKAFPYDPENRMGIGADVYTADEMAQAERHDAPPPQPTLAERAAQKAAETRPEPPRAAEPVEVVSGTTEPPYPAVGQLIVPVKTNAEPHQHRFVDSDVYNDPVCEVCGVHPEPEAESVAAFTEVEAPKAGGCGWKLELKGGEVVPCTLPDEHPGEHTFVDAAVRTGGKVVRP